MTYKPAYLRYDELTAYLQDLVARHPNRVRLESIGKSPEGRDIWVATVGRFDEGDPDQKPGYWVDGLTHASELMSGAACVHTLHRLTDGADAATDSLLEHATIYVAPCITPDGADFVLRTNEYVRSAPRIWPEARPQLGLVEGDIDGDGWVLQMRIESPEGAWVASTKDPRAMLPRKPWDEGPFYHLYGEGTFEDDVLEDPRFPMLEMNPASLDFNRNYPYKWRPKGQQFGAGEYPLSEPETRAIVDYLLAHPNIGGITSYHTYSGILLRPFSDRADTEMPKFDRYTYRVFGERCQEVTGFPCVSTFHDFRYDDTDITTGVFDDWAYESLGVHAFTMELWCPWKHAGLDFSHDFLAFWRDRDESVELALLKWNDEKLGGDKFVDWHEVDHPQIGKVEVGGWKWLYAFRNCPESMLEDEIAPSVEFTLDHARGLPRPAIELEAKREGDLVRVTATLRNHGFLPTNITDMAVKMQAVGKPHLDLELSEGLTIEQGKAHQRTEHLQGHANVTHQTLTSSAFHGKTRRNVMQYHWLLRGDGTVRLSWSGDRIGTTEAVLEV